MGVTGVMERLSISEFTTLRWSFQEDVENYAEQGIRGIGIWRTKLDDYELDYCADLLYEHNLRVSSLSWIGGFTGSDGRSFVDALADARAAIRTAARLNCDCLLIHPGGRAGHTFSHARRLFASALAELVPLSVDYGVRLALEPMKSPDSADWTVFPNLDDSFDFVGEYDPRALGIVLDLFHVGCEVGLLHRLENLIHRIALVQMADHDFSSSPQQDRCPLGCGSVPLEMWIERLQTLGYNGAYEVEVFGQATEGTPYPLLLEQAKRFWSRRNCAPAA